MISIDEMLAWTNAEIVVQVEALKPEGHTFHHGYDRESQLWYVRIELVGQIVWDDASPDERLSLLNAFGWVWAQRQTQPKPGSIWHRRHELTPEAVTKRVSLKDHPISDPEDLDPSEVRAVYERTRPQK